jgi:hypothetical protein
MRAALHTRACRRNPPAPACCRSIGSPMLGGPKVQRLKGTEMEVEEFLRVRPEAATTCRTCSAGSHPSNPARARGLKMLTLNSSILVAAPRWRLLCVAVSLGTGTSAGPPAKWRTPSSANRILAVRSAKQSKRHRVLRGRRKLEKVCRRCCKKGSRLGRAAGFDRTPHCGRGQRRCQ